MYRTESCRTGCLGSYFSHFDVVIACQSGEEQEPNTCARAHSLTLFLSCMRTSIYKGVCMCTSTYEQAQTHTYGRAQTHTYTSVQIKKSQKSRVRKRCERKRPACKFLKGLRQGVGRALLVIACDSQPFSLPVNRFLLFYISFFFFDRLERRLSSLPYHINVSAHACHQLNILP